MQGWREKNEAREAARQAELARQAAEVKDGKGTVYSRYNVVSASQQRLGNNEGMVNPNVIINVQDTSPYAGLNSSTTTVTQAVLGKDGVAGDKASPEEVKLFVYGTTAVTVAATVIAVAPAIVASARHL